MKFIVMPDPSLGPGVLLLKNDSWGVVVYHEAKDISGTAYWREGASTGASASGYSPYWCLLRFVDWQQADKLPTVEKARAMLGVAE